MIVAARGRRSSPGKRLLAVEPIDLLDDADGPLFDAAMALVMVDVAVDRWLGEVESAFVSARRVG